MRNYPDSRPREVADTEVERSDAAVWLERYLEAERENERLRAGIRAEIIHLWSCHREPGTVARLRKLLDER